MTLSLFQRAASEAIGTFALVLCGCGAIIVDAQSGAITHVGVALVFGLTIMTMIAAMGHLSGAHFNPAVTSSLVLVRKMPLRDAPAYVLAQCTGACIAAYLLFLLFGSDVTLGVTLPITKSSSAFLVEFVLSAVLVFVIVAVATDRRAAGHLAAIVIGGVVAFCAL